MDVGTIQLYNVSLSSPLHAEIAHSLSAIRKVSRIQMARQMSACSKIQARQNHIEFQRPAYTTQASTNLITWYRYTISTQHLPKVEPRIPDRPGWSANEVQISIRVG